MERRQRTKNSLINVLTMTEQEAKQTIADLAADFLANPYDLRNDLITNQKGFNPEFEQAVEILGEDWDANLIWTVTAEYDGIKVTA